MPSSERLQGCPKLDSHLSNRPPPPWKAIRGSTDVRSEVWGRPEGIGADLLQFQTDFSAYFEDHSLV